MKAHDLLLFWLSERRLVPAARMAASCRWLAEQEGLRLSRRGGERAWSHRCLRLLAGPLQRFGHAELIPTPPRWAVVAPVCLWRASPDGGQGELYGARSPPLGRWLAEKFGANFHAAAVARGPERWLVRAGREELERGLADFEPAPIAVAEERGLDLLRALPSLKAALPHAEKYSPSREAAGWQQCIFPPRGRSAHAWRDLGAAPLDTRDGLYRERLPGRQRWFHLAAGRMAELVASEHRLLAWWREYARSGACRLRYRSTVAELLVPAGGLPLPVLLDRALRLPSGEAPRPLDSGAWMRYLLIEPARADEARRVLDAPLDRE